MCLLIYSNSPFRRYGNFSKREFIRFGFRRTAVFTRINFYPALSEVSFGYSTSQTMDVNTFMILYWYHRRRGNRNKRKYWVYPIVKQRFYVGTLTALNVCPYTYPMFCPIKQAFLQLNLSKSRD
jgi:hypothetical protein